MQIDIDKIRTYCRSHTGIREIINEALLFDRVDSTNNIALEMASNGLPEGVAILAEAQTDGKGRLDRNWFSPPGRNIYLSLLLRPSLPVREYPLFSPATSVGLVDAIEAFTGLNVGIKWPNDLFVSGKKLGGILLSTGTAGGQSAALVIGVGINVNLGHSDFPDALQSTATSLQAQLDHEIDRTGLTIALIEGISKQIRHLQSGERYRVIQAVRERCLTLGKKIRVATPHQVFEGWAEAIEIDGALRIRMGDQSRRKILIGDITHLRESTPIPS